MFYKDGQFNIKSSWNDKEQPKSLNELEKEGKAISNIEKAKVKGPGDKGKDISDILDNEMAKRILNDFKYEGGFKSIDKKLSILIICREGKSYSSVKAISWFTLECSQAQYF